MPHSAIRPWQRRRELELEASKLLRRDRIKRPRPTRLIEPPAPAERMPRYEPEPITGARVLRLSDLKHLHPLAVSK